MRCRFFWYAASAKGFVRCGHAAGHIRHHEYLEGLRSRDGGYMTWVAVGAENSVEGYWY